MSPSVPPLDVRTPESGDRGGGVHPPEIGGGGGRDPGDGSPDYDKRLQRARIGLICGVIAVSMIFAMLTVVFFGRQTAFVLDSQTHHYVRKWVPVVLPVRILLWNTLLLLCSSITLELARRQVAQAMVLAPLRAIVGVDPERRLHAPWLVVTALLGILFLFGQWLAWLEFRSHGFRASTSGPSPFFYLLTGTHALHLMVGILGLIYAAIFSLFHQTIEHKRIVVEVTRWYWHFMSALWLYVFALLWFAQ
jgi:cytochrome c oxidase subunit III